MTLESLKKNGDSDKIRDFIKLDGPEKFENFNKITGIKDGEKLKESKNFQKKLVFVFKFKFVNFCFVGFF